MDIVAKYIFCELSSDSGRVWINFAPTNGMNTSRFTSMEAT